MQLPRHPWHVTGLGVDQVKTGYTPNTPKTLICVGMLRPQVHVSGGAGGRLPVGRRVQLPAAQAGGSQEGNAFGGRWAASGARKVMRLQPE